jgi:hypothetical protein
MNRGRQYLSRDDSRNAMVYDDHQIARITSHLFTSIVRTKRSQKTVQDIGMERNTSSKMKNTRDHIEIKIEADMDN